MQRISEWAMRHKLKLLKARIPAATHLTRVESLKVLGVTFSTKLSFEPHISYIVQSAASSFYGLKTFPTHGLTGKSLKDVTQATLIARIMTLYAIPAWWGFLNVAEKRKRQALRLPTKRFWKCALTCWKYGIKTFWQHSVQHQPCITSATTSWKEHSL